MPLDPSLDAVAQTGDPSARLSGQLSDLRRRVDALERNAPTIQVQPGAPSGSAREGTPAASSGTPRLWLFLNGAWRFTNLT